MKTKIIFLSVVMIAFFYASKETNCQELYVWGNVKWITGYPSVGIEVRLIRYDGVIVSNTYTNQSGSYAFFGISGQPSSHFISIYYRDNMINKTRIPEIAQGQQIPDIVLDKILMINARVEPNNISTGQRTSIEVHVYDEMGNFVQGAKVTVTAGGGKFLQKNESFNQHMRLHEPYQSSGFTDTSGKYTTYWVCNPCAGGYGISIQCNKEGYIPGGTELMINLK